KTINGQKVLDNVSFIINPNEKVAFVGKDDLAKTTLFEIINGEMKADSGTYHWGVTTSQSYFPKDNSAFFDDSDLNLVDWLRQFSPEDETETFLRSFLGRMLFSGEEALKKAKVLSGGEKVRCMLSKMMLCKIKELILDEPTCHLDFESIKAVTNGLINITSSILFTSCYHAFVNSIADRVIEASPSSIVDKSMSYYEYVR